MSVTDDQIAEVLAMHSALEARWQECVDRAIDACIAAQRARIELEEARTLADDANFLLLKLARHLHDRRSSAAA